MYLIHACNYVTLPSDVSHIVHEAIRRKLKVPWVLFGLSCTLSMYASIDYFQAVYYVHYYVAIHCNNYYMPPLPCLSVMVLDC